MALPKPPIVRKVPGWHRATLGNPFCEIQDSVFVIMESLDVMFPDTTVCEGVSITLDVTTLNATYEWQDGSFEPTLEVNEPGTYWVEIGLQHCSITDTIKVFHAPGFEVNLGNDTLVCEGDTVFLDATTVDATYEWQDGSTNATFEAIDQGLYSVTVTQTNCIVIDEINVSTEECKECGVIVPSAFSPNGDDLNDGFRAYYPSGCSFNNYQIMVYNRLGQKSI